MLPHKKYFSSVPCPDNEEGECWRPYCHFFHKFKSTVNNRTLRNKNIEQQSWPVTAGGMNSTHSLGLIASAAPSSSVSVAPSSSVSAAPSSSVSAAPSNLASAVPSSSGLQSAAASSVSVNSSTASSFSGADNSAFSVPATSGTATEIITSTAAGSSSSQYSVESDDLSNELDDTADDKLQIDEEAMTSRDSEDNLPEQGNDQLTAVNNDGTSNDTSDKNDTDSTVDKEKCLNVPDTNNGSDTNKDKCLNVPDTNNGSYTNKEKCLNVPDTNNGNDTNKDKCLNVPDANNGSYTNKEKCLNVPDTNNGNDTNKDKCLNVPDANNGSYTQENMEKDDAEANDVTEDDAEATDITEESQDETLQQNSCLGSEHDSDTQSVVQSPDSNALLSETLLQSDLLKKLVSEAVKKYISDNPLLANVDPSKIVRKINTSAIANSIALKPVISSTTASSSVINAAAAGDNPKKRRLYLRPSGIPDYKPTPISELKRRRSANECRNSNDNKLEDMGTDYCPSTKAADDSETTDFSSDDNDNEQEKRNLEFDMLEEVMAEKSKSNAELYKSKEFRKRKKALGKVKSSVSTSKSATASDADDSSKIDVNHSCKENIEGKELLTTAANDKTSNRVEEVFSKPHILVPVISSQIKRKPWTPGSKPIMKPMPDMLEAMLQVLDGVSSIKNAEKSATPPAVATETYKIADLGKEIESLTNLTGEKTAANDMEKSGVDELEKQAENKDSDKPLNTDNNNEKTNEEIKDTDKSELSVSDKDKFVDQKETKCDSPACDIKKNEESKGKHGKDDKKREATCSTNKKDSKDKSELRKKDLNDTKDDSKNVNDESEKARKNEGTDQSNSDALDKKGSSDCDSERSDHKRKRSRSRDRSSSREHRRRKRRRREKKKRKHNKSKKKRRKRSYSTDYESQDAEHSDNEARGGVDGENYDKELNIKQEKSDSEKSNRNSEKYNENASKDLKSDEDFHSDYSDSRRDNRSRSKKRKHSKHRKKGKHKHRKRRHHSSSYDSSSSNNSSSRKKKRHADLNKVKQEEYVDVIDLTIIKDESESDDNIQPVVVANVKQEKNKDEDSAKENLFQNEPVKVKLEEESNAARNAAKLSNIELKESEEAEKKDKKTLETSEAERAEGFTSAVEDEKSGPVKSERSNNNNNRHSHSRTTSVDSNNTEIHGDANTAPPSPTPNDDDDIDINVEPPADDGIVTTLTASISKGLSELSSVFSTKTKVLTEISIFDSLIDSNMSSSIKTIRKKKLVEELSSSSLTPTLTVAEDLLKKVISSSSTTTTSSHRSSTSSRTHSKSKLETETSSSKQVSKTSSKSSSSSNSYKSSSVLSSTKDSSSKSSKRRSSGSTDSKVSVSNINDSGKSSQDHQKHSHKTYSKDQQEKSSSRHESSSSSDRKRTTSSGSNNNKKEVASSSKSKSSCHSSSGSSSGSKSRSQKDSESSNKKESKSDMSKSKSDMSKSKTDMSKSKSHGSKNAVNQQVSKSSKTPPSQESEGISDRDTFCFNRGPSGFSSGEEDTYSLGGGEGDCSPLPDLSALDDIPEEDWDHLLSGTAQSAAGADDDAVAEDECLRLYNDFQQPEPPLPSAGKKRASSTSSSGDSTAAGLSSTKSSIQRKAHPGASGNLLRRPNLQSLPHRRKTPDQIMIERYAKLKSEKDSLLKEMSAQRAELERRSGATGISLSTAATTAGKGITHNTTAASAAAGTALPLGGSKKPRIGPVSNVSAMLSASKTLKRRLPEAAVSSRPSPSSASKYKNPSTSDADRKKNPAIPTLATAGGKGFKRVPHIPKSELLARPVIASEFGGKVPQNIRQRYLNSFVDEALKFADDQTQAFKIAVSEEKICYKRASSRAVYLSLAVNTTKRLRGATVSDQAKEIMEEIDLDSITPTPSSSSGGAASSAHPAPLRIPTHNRVQSHFSTMVGGGQKGSWSIEKPVKADIQAKMDSLTGVKLYQYVLRYLASQEQLTENGYPQAHPDVKGKAIAKAGSRKRISPSPTERHCARCGTIFLVDKWGFPKIFARCVYHWGRANKRRGACGWEARYSCCQGDGESDGCCLASTHVSDNHHPDNLTGFVRTLPKEPDRTGDFGVYALDCEMCYTTDGNELTRITVVNFKNDVVYESYVQPDNHILDYNTRFSGISEEDLEDVSTTLVDVQAALLSRFSASTVLIGHSLESDFMALKLIHNNVIDTSFMFPHKMGPPFKRALRNLASEYLKKIIQNDVGGHDSTEDAITCMDLLHWKIKEDLKRASNV
uniref:RNA exonuclease 1 homolog n=2 Tax=Hirondellea gigas TaxID=1518452 RepID=A0A6A7FTK6_9CRUS